MSIIQSLNDKTLTDRQLIEQRKAAAMQKRAHGFQEQKKPWGAKLTGIKKHAASMAVWIGVSTVATNILPRLSVAATKMLSKTKLLAGSQFAKAAEAIKTLGKPQTLGNVIGRVIETNQGTKGIWGFLNNAYSKITESKSVKSFYAWKQAAANLKENTGGLSRAGVNLRNLKSFFKPDAVKGVNVWHRLGGASFDLVKKSIKHFPSYYIASKATGMIAKRSKSIKIKGAA